MLAILERPGYGSETLTDAHCPHCGAHEQHHATVQVPPSTVSKCPVCGASVRLSVDRNGALCVAGQCAHMQRITSIDGQMIAEFAAK